MKRTTYKNNSLILDPLRSTHSMNRFNRRVCKCIWIVLLYIPFSSYFQLKKTLKLKLQSRCLFRLLPFDCYYGNPNESFKSWIRIPAANGIIQAILKLLSRPIIQPSGIKIICLLLPLDPTGAFCWRRRKTTNCLPDAASKCDASFIPALADDGFNSRGFSWDINVLLAVVWLSFGFYQPFTTEWRAFMGNFNNVLEDQPLQTTPSAGERAIVILFANIGAHPGRSAEPRVN